jgi:hypothetical protein
MDFAGYRYVAMLVVLIEIAVILMTYRRNPKLAIYVVLLSIVLKGQYLWFGRAIFAWQVASIFGLAYIGSGQIRRTARNAGRALGFMRMSMLLYFIYTISISFPMWLVFSAEGLGNAGTEVNATRILTQLVYFGFVIGLFGLGLRAGRHLTTASLLNAIIIIAALAAYGAILQTLIMHLVGINIFPIIGSDDTTRSAFILGSTFRANSFVGEPKHLGLLMSMGLISYYLTRLFRIPAGGRFAWHKPLAMTAALILSLSTTGIVITAGVDDLLPPPESQRPSRRQYPRRGAPDTGHRIGRRFRVFSRTTIEQDGSGSAGPERSRRVVGQQEPFRHGHRPGQHSPDRGGPSSRDLPAVSGPGLQGELGPVLRGRRQRSHRPTPACRESLLRASGLRPDATPPGTGSKERGAGKSGAPARLGLSSQV